MQTYCRVPVWKRRFRVSSNRIWGRLPSLILFLCIKQQDIKVLFYNKQTSYWTDSFESNSTPSSLVKNTVVLSKKKKEKERENTVLSVFFFVCFELLLQLAPCIFFPNVTKSSLVVCFTHVEAQYQPSPSCWHERNWLLLLWLQLK